MPSPFPGMDPYLERRDLWPGLHASLIVVAQELLAPQVRPRFWVGIEERIYVEEEDLPLRSIRPDLTISAEERRRSRGATSTLPLPGYLEVAEADSVPVRETYLVIRELPNRRVVTVIEILSPSNKNRSSIGMSEYSRKRLEVLASRASLVEIDLLRSGERPPSQGDLPPHDYLVLIHRGWERPRVWAAPWRLPDRIPLVSVPLLPADPPVTLDLLHALRLAYERGAYDLILDYQKPPEPLLPPDQQSWAATLLASRA